MKTILIIDSAPMQSQKLEAYLVREKYKVLTAANGEQALPIIRSNRIEIIITEVHLPEMSGFDLLEHVLELKAPPPVLFYSADLRADTVNLLKKKGASGFIAKPLHINVLLEAIEAITTPPTAEKPLEQSA